ncbi:MAG TPA: hypothetical protein VEZ48_02225 [Sphingomonadaceae bacterium]|nr:hypothetical protein [Sphingomonadaceae bacterium]
MSERLDSRSAPDHSVSKRDPRTTAESGAWYGTRKRAYAGGMTEPGSKPLSIKERIGDATGMSDKLLHVHGGMAIFLLSAMALGKPLSDPLPLLIVVAAELANELRDRIINGSWRWADTLGDIASTLFWPVLIFAFLRLSPAG